MTTTAPPVNTRGDPWCAHCRDYHEPPVLDRRLNYCTEWPAIAQHIHEGLDRVEALCERIEAGIRAMKRRRTVERRRIATAAKRERVEATQ